MARARNIKPGFFSNEDLVELPFEFRLLFIGLWTISDREGRLEDRPKRIKIEIFPADLVDIDNGLNQLQEAGFILRYEVDEKKYIQIINFRKHQSPHKDERQSEIPAPNLYQPNTVLGQCQHRAKTPDSLNDDSLKEDSPKDKQKPGYSPEFESAWEIYPKRPGLSKKEAYKAWSARIKAGVPPDEMIDGVTRYSAYVRATQTQPQFVKHAATFFGPDEHFRSDWTPPPRASPHQSKQEKTQDFIDRLTGNHRHDNRIIDIN